DRSSFFLVRFATAQFNDNVLGRELTDHLLQPLCETKEAGAGMNVVITWRINAKQNDPLRASELCDSQSSQNIVANLQLAARGGHALVEHPGVHRIDVALHAAHSEASELHLVRQSPVLRVWIQAYKHVCPGGEPQGTIDGDRLE